MHMFIPCTMSCYVLCQGNIPETFFFFLAQLIKYLCTPRNGVMIWLYEAGRLTYLNCLMEGSIRILSDTVKHVGGFRCSFR